MSELTDSASTSESAALARQVSERNQSPTSSPQLDAQARRSSRLLAFCQAATRVIADLAFEVAR
jgi:hypothetical protein